MLAARAAQLGFLRSLISQLQPAAGGRSAAALNPSGKCLVWLDERTESLALHGCMPP
jgi:hypothetical protein